MRGTKILLLLFLFLLLSELGSSWWSRRRRRRRKCYRKNCVFRRGKCNRWCGHGWYHFHIKSRAKCGGSCNPPKQRCFIKHCPVNCRLNNWGAWGACSNSCGLPGTQVRHRTVKVAAKHNGKCPTLKQTRKCAKNKEVCRWKYVKCSKRCGRGRQIFKLTSTNCCGRCKQPVKFCHGRGRNCPKVRTCKTTNWGKWGPCKVKGHRGIKIRTRKVKKGRNCVTERQTHVCCRRKNCTWKWGACVRIKYSPTRGIQKPRLAGKASCGGTCRRPRDRSCSVCKRRHGDEQSQILAANDDKTEVEDILAADNIPLVDNDSFQQQDDDENVEGLKQEEGNNDFDESANEEDNQDLEGKIVEDVDDLDENVEYDGENNEIEYPEHLLDNAEVEIDLKPEDSPDLEKEEQNEKQEDDSVEDSEDRNDALDAPRDGEDAAVFDALEDDLQSRLDAESNSEEFDGAGEGSLEDVEDLKKLSADLEEDLKEDDQDEDEPKKPDENEVDDQSEESADSSESEEIQME